MAQVQAMQLNAQRTFLGYLSKWLKRQIGMEHWSCSGQM